MINSINIKHFKKLKALNLSFSPTINVISGANGTCKTSLLYMISNSFQEPKLESNQALKIIRKINEIFNPKIETITKGDKTFNDPAHGTTGVMYNVNYNNKQTLGFRRHNSRKPSLHPRYAVKPQYSADTKESLPSIPVIYLSLFRLIPFGELQDNIKTSNSNINLPENYLSDLNKYYKELTRIEVSDVKVQNVGSMKKRNDFTSKNEGVDSNTISAGEDNIRIILNAIYSLKFYYEEASNKETDSIKSILIIDEFDATLHPSMQIKLMQIIMDFSLNYKIQVFFTTHSLYLIEYLIKAKQNIIYLIDQVDSVTQLAEPDVYKIQMHLEEKTSFNLYSGKCIPVLTEDKEAREFLGVIFNYLKSTDSNFGKIVSYFHLVQTNIGSEIIENLFKDKFMKKTTINCIGIIDGDHNSNIINNIISLLGRDNPEQVVFKYLENLDDKFWNSNDILDNGFSKSYYINIILPDINSIESSINTAKEQGISTKGMKREKQKKVFNDHLDFFGLVMSYWVNDERNKEEINNFKKGLYSLFKKSATINGISSNLWREEVNEEIA